GAETGNGAAKGADRRLAIERPWTIAEPRQRRRHRREGVGLVLHHRDQQAHFRISMAPALMPLLDASRNYGYLYSHYNEEIRCDRLQRCRRQEPASEPDRQSARR